MTYLLALENQGGACEAASHPGQLLVPGEDLVLFLAASD